MSTFTDLLGVNLTEGQGGKETVTNGNFDQIAETLAGVLSKSVAGSSNVTLTDTAGGESSHFVYVFTGTLTASINVIVPTKSRVFVAYNNTTGAFSLTVKTSGGTGVAVQQGRWALMYCDGVNVVQAVLSSVSTPASVPSFTVASVPSATLVGQMIYVSNETGGAVLAFSDGTNWRRVTDRAIVS